MGLDKSRLKELSKVAAQNDHMRKQIDAEAERLHQKQMSGKKFTRLEQLFYTLYGYDNRRQIIIKNLSTPKDMPLVSGEYDENGYAVFVDGEEVYSAGNNPDESQSHSTDKPLPLKKLRQYCLISMEQIADERKGVVHTIKKV